MVGAATRELAAAQMAQPQPKLRCCMRKHALTLTAHTGRSIPMAVAKTIATTSTKPHTNHATHRNESTRFNSFDLSYSWTGITVNDNVTPEETMDVATC